MAERKRIAEQIKTAKAAKKAQNGNKEQRANTWALRTLTQQIRARVKHGISHADALEQVFTMYRSAVEAALNS